MRALRMHPAGVEDTHYGPRVADAYDAADATLARQLHRHVAWRAIRRVLPPAPARVLDAGAGTGAYAVPLLAQGYAVTLLDPSRDMLDVARRKATASGAGEAATFVVGGLPRLAFPDASFDVVLSEGDPLSYCVGEAETAAREVLRVLRPGGTFHVGVDSRGFATVALLARGDAARAREAAEEGRSFDPYGSRVHAFSPSELRALFEGAGARDVRVGGNGVVTPFVPERVLAALLADAGTRAWLLDAEGRASEDAHFCGLAGHLHVSGRRGDAA